MEWIPCVFSWKTFSCFFTTPPLSPVVGQSNFARLADEPPTPLRSSDTGAGIEAEAPAEFAVVAETIGSREGVGSVVQVGGNRI
jgi:hypothetical protein